MTSKFNNILFYADQKEFLIPISYDAQKKISEKIQRALFEKGNYSVESNVRGDIFQIFVDYWINNKEISFNSDNIYELYLLSKEFELDLGIEGNKEYKDDFAFSILNKATLKNQNKEINEDFIANNIVFYLNNYPNQLSEVPITSLCNIFNNENFNLNGDHDLAYKFITGFQSGTRNSNLFVLIQFIDANCLSSEARKDYLLNHDLYFNFLPKNLFNCFVQIQNENDALKQQNETLKQQNQKLQQDQVIKEELQMQNKHFQKEIKDLKCQIMHQNDQMKRQNQHIQEQRKDNARVKSNIEDKKNEIKLLKQQKQDQQHENELLKRQNQDFQKENELLKQKIEIKNDNKVNSRITNAKRSFYHKNAKRQKDHLLTIILLLFKFILYILITILLLKSSLSNPKIQYSCYVKFATKEIDNWSFANGLHSHYDIGMPVNKSKTSDIIMKEDNRRHFYAKLFHACKQYGDGIEAHKIQALLHFSEISNENALAHDVIYYNMINDAFGIITKLPFYSFFGNVTAKFFDHQTIFQIFYIFAEHYLKYLLNTRLV